MAKYDSSPNWRNRDENTRSYNNDTSRRGRGRGRGRGFRGGSGERNTRTGYNSHRDDNRGDRNDFRRSSDSHSRSREEDRYRFNNESDRSENGKPRFNTDSKDFDKQNHSNNQKRGKKRNENSFRTDNHKDGRLGDASKIFANQVVKKKESLLPLVYKAILTSNKEYMKKVKINKHLEVVELSSETFPADQKSKFSFKISLEFDRFRGFLLVKKVEGECYLIASCTNPELASLRDKLIRPGMKIEQGFAIACDRIKKTKTGPVMISFTLKRDDLHENDKEYIGDFENIVASAQQDKKRKRIERNTVKVAKKHKKTDFPEYETPDPIEKQYSDSDYYLNLQKVANGTWTGDEEKGAALKERIYYSEDEKVLIVYPPIAFSTNHLVILPRDEKIESLESLTSSHLSLIRHIEDVAKDIVAHLTSQDELLATANPFLHEFRFGVVGLWFQKGCPFQIISIDFEGDVDMKKTYWNSLMTDIFYTSSTIKKALKTQGKIVLDSSALLEKRRLREFSCPKCGEFEIQKKFQTFFTHYKSCGVDNFLMRKIMEGEVTGEGHQPEDAIEALTQVAPIPEGDGNSKSKAKVNIHSKFNPFGR